jgi:hypothetical protein
VCSASAADDGLVTGIAKDVLAGIIVAAITGLAAIIGGAYYKCIRTNESPNQASAEVVHVNQ